MSLEIADGLPGQSRPEIEMSKISATGDILSIKKTPKFTHAQLELQNGAAELVEGLEPLLTAPRAGA